MNELMLVQKVWNYAHLLRDQGVSYQTYISQIPDLLFLKMGPGRSPVGQGEVAVCERRDPPPHPTPLCPRGREGRLWID